MSLTLLQNAELISQGAEAKVYKATLHANESRAGHPVLLKHRFKKNYRHPTLDHNLTRARVAGEARSLLRCLRCGVSVPGLRMVDASEGLLAIEWIHGSSVRRLLPGGGDDEEQETDLDALSEYNTTQDRLMELIGIEIAKLHAADLIHGDLTTSNMMLRSSSDTHLNPLVLIDFGLAYQSNLVEDKAVDLYVLERAFVSTHPDAEEHFSKVLAAYEKQLGSKLWKPLYKRLEEVRLRGRKRSMVG